MGRGRVLRCWITLAGCWRSRDLRDGAGGEVGCCSWEGIGCIGAYAFEVLGEESVWDVQIPVLFSPYLPIHGQPHLIDIHSATIGLLVLYAKYHYDVNINDNLMTIWFMPI